MVTIRTTTKEQLRAIISQVGEARRSATSPSTIRWLQQAAALLDAAAEMLDMVDQPTSTRHSARAVPETEPPVSACGPEGDAGCSASSGASAGEAQKQCINIKKRDAR